MMVIDKQLVVENFSRSADNYDDHASVQKKCATRLTEILGGEKFPRILEIGCGTGMYTQLLRDSYKDAEITAVDISEAMMSKAKDKLEGGNVHFMVGDGECMKFDGKFDLITSNASFQWFESMERTIKIFSKALTEKGILCFSMYGCDTFREFKRVLDIHYGSRSWLTSSRFASFEELESVLNIYFKRPYLEEEFFTVRFSSLLNFLRNIKQSGSRGDGLDNDIYLGRYGLKDIEKKYLREFGGVFATHHVYFCRMSV
ncbi:malonyl-ACP O-methyltransferase BioC [Candidatus Omnitrophota bacterium]